ncbi:MAG TPA: NUDIX hydrolase [Dermatophilaceae bacterium]|nr:NUDIX hydrolase [Dermatophilaceae bacterium]
MEPRERDFPLRDYAELRERAEAWRAGRLPEPPAPRLASTVMLVRDAEAAEGGTSGVEVFMLRRVSTMAFAPSVMVFPGGGVDPRDSHDVPWSGPSPTAWAARLGVRDDDQARMLVVAAVREVYEECGVLLAASGDDGAALHRELVDTSVEPWPAIRAGLEARELSLAEVLREQQLRLRTDLLRLEAHWVTPVIETRQYDTRIFAALMPAGRHADGETSEAEVAEWVRPQAVIDGYAAGQAMVLPPTLTALEHLARHTSAVEFLECEPDVRRIRPEPVLLDDGQVVLRAVH